uniref:Uncharacterized protein n=1 Tax=Opuntia streptacantha TaxID=393608 RepID=A0A7C9DJ39_OPUST
MFAYNFSPKLKLSHGHIKLSSHRRRWIDPLLGTINKLEVCTANPTHSSPTKSRPFLAPTNPRRKLIATENMARGLTPADTFIEHRHLIHLTMKSLVIFKLILE